MSDEAARWLDFVRQDRRMAELALAEKLWGQACLHAEQCAEKALKAVLARRDKTPPRTHRLADLLHLLGDKTFEAIADDLRALDRFYLPTRYPDVLPGSPSEISPGEAEAKEALGLAREVLRDLEA